MKIHLFYINFLLLVSGIMPVLGKEYQFDASQLGNAVSGVDVDIFNDGGQLPGTYPVDIYVNNNLEMQKDIYFYNTYSNKEKPVLEPCLNRKILIQLGILIDNYPQAREISAGGEAGMCTVLKEIPHFQIDFNLLNQELHITVPQVAIRKKSYGIASQESWDDGISAFRLNYDISGARTKFSDGADRSNDEVWSTFQPGLNYRGWRLRNLTNITKRSGENASWERGVTYATTSFNAIKSSMTIGEIFTHSDIFQPYLIRGMTLNTDEGMYPSSMRIFSPVVKGIARTQAKVTVISNGITLFSDLVPPGPFQLDELPLFSQKGELLVTINEADGQRQEFTVPWQAPAIAVPEGYLRYSVIAGEYQSNGVQSKKPEVFQSTAIYGLNERITLYAGYQGTSEFYALLSGAGASLGSYGSTSLDYSLSRNSRSGHPAWGIWRLRYSSQIESSGTGLQLENIRYTSSGTQTLSSAVYSSDKAIADKNSPRSQLNLSLNQSARQYGSFYINASYQQNFDGSKNQNLGGGYSWSIPGSGNLMLDWYEQNTTRESEKKKERIISLMLNLPLEKVTGFPFNSAYRRTAFGKSITQDYTFSGSSTDQSFFWNAGHNIEKSPSSENVKTTSVQLMLETRSAQMSAWYSHNNAWETTGTSISGGMIIHSDGITAGPSLGETITLVDTGGAGNASFFNAPNVAADSRGYAIIPSVPPYQATNISLDPSTLADNVEIEHTDTTVTPTRGAITSAKFSSRTGNQAFFSLRRKNGDPVPFGSVASLSTGEGESTGIVDEFGRVFMAGLPDAGVINIKSGKERCNINYKLNDENKKSDIYMLSEVCI